MSNFRKNHIVKILTFLLFAGLISPLIYSFTQPTVKPDIVLIYNSLLFDKSFNEQTYNALVKAEEEDGITFGSSFVDPSNENDFTSFVDQLFNFGVQGIIANSYLYLPSVEAIEDSLEENEFIIYVDDSEKAFNGEEHPQVKSIYFEAQEASFLAGVLSSMYLVTNYENPEDWKVGMWGGMNFSAVVSLMAGFEYGINWFNEYVLNDDIYNGGSKVELIKPGKGEYTGWFAGTFEVDGTGERFTITLIDKGAKLIFPIAGGQTAEALKVIDSNNKDAMIIGVDTDTKITYPTYSEYVLTSAIKNIELAVYESVSCFNNENSDDIRDCLKEEEIYNQENNGVGVTDIEEGTDNANDYYIFKESDLIDQEFLLELNNPVTLTDFLNESYLHAISKTSNNTIPTTSCTFVKC